MRSGGIELVGESPGVNQIWSWRNVLITTWTGKPSPEAAFKLGPLTDEIAARAGVQSLSYIHLVSNNLPLPDADTREALLELSRIYAHRTACVAVVISGGGFWASAIRSFVTGIRVLAPRNFDLRIHTDMGELQSWFPEEHARKTGVVLDPTELMQHVEHALHTRAA